MPQDRDAALGVALMVNVAMASHELQSDNFKGARRALLRVVKALRKHNDEDGALALAGLASGDKNADQFANGVAEVLDTLEQLESIVRQGDDSAVWVTVLAMKALVLRARPVRATINPRPHEFSGVHGEPITPEYRELLERFRLLALRIQSLSPTMLPHDIAMRLFSDMIVPLLPRALRKDRELCDWIVRSIRESISPNVL